ncbi:syntaxin-17 isoform X2 [Ictalurus furcatus]|uniref:syntaxin-17 isoform X2 n=1 Tax=Ictalurus furcatus TaxID=66913 RepID=UPI002350B34D|nr:syntaxin-17 isoform X2 [Ictalurus furcatus]
MIEPVTFRRDRTMADEEGKLTLRRLEAPIQKFIKVVIPTDLERLHKHQHNIEKFHRNSQWDRLHQEHINASRTVQQLRSNLREMEKLCQRVRSSEAPALEKLVQPIRERASVATQDFLRLHSDSVSHPGPHLEQTDSTDTHAVSDSAYSEEEDVGGAESPVTQFQVHLPAIPAEQNAAESWDSLEEDLLELNGLVNEFCSLVHAQQEKIDSIEANVSAASTNVEEGTRSLGKVRRERQLPLGDRSHSSPLLQPRPSNSIGSSIHTGVQGSAFEPGSVACSRCSDWHRLGRSTRITGGI